MIPYEDLVIALQTWRAKQGLPVGQMSGTFAPPPIAKAAPPPPPARPAPPAPPVRAASPAAPPPLAELEVEEHAEIDESHYENEGGDFAMSFDAAAAAAMHAQLHGDHAEHQDTHDAHLDDEESTSIGTPPPRHSEGGFGVATDPNPLGNLGHEDETEDLAPPTKRAPGRNDDW